MISSIILIFSKPMDLRKSFRSFSLYFKEIDWPLFATTVAILLLSFINLYGIDGWNGPFLYRHAIFIGIGLAVMVALSFFNYRYLKNYSSPVMIFYGLAI